MSTFLTSLNISSSDNYTFLNNKMVYRSVHIVWLHSRLYYMIIYSLHLNSVQRSLFEKGMCAIVCAAFVREIFVSKGRVSICKLCYLVPWQISLIGESSLNDSAHNWDHLWSHERFIRKILQLFEEILLEALWQFELDFSHVVIVNICCTKAMYLPLIDTTGGLQLSEIFSIFCCREDGLVSPAPSYGLDWFEGAIARPDQVLQDFVHAVNPANSSVRSLGNQRSTSSTSFHLW